MRLQRPAEAHATDDAGITLIELMIYMVLSVVVLLLVGNVMIQSFRVQNSVSTSNGATGSGQLVINSLEDGIRNSTTLTQTSNASGDLLVARTNNKAGTVSCGYQAWYFSSTAKGIYTKSSTTAITAPTTTAQLDAWVRIAGNITKSGATAVFATAALQVEVRFNVTPSSGSPVPFKTTVISNGTTLESYECS